MEASGRVEAESRDSGSGSVAGSGGGWLAMTRPGRWSARRQGNWKRQGREGTYRTITCTVAPLGPPVWTHREIQRHVVG